MGKVGGRKRQTRNPIKIVIVGFGNFGGDEFVLAIKVIKVNAIVTMLSKL